MLILYNRSRARKLKTRWLPFRDFVPCEFGVDGIALVPEATVVGPLPLIAGVPVLKLFDLEGA